MAYLGNAEYGVHIYMFAFIVTVICIHILLNALTAYQQIFF